MKNKDNLKRTYSLCGVIFLGVCVFLSKIVNIRIRLIRFPIVIRGKKYIDFGHNLTTGYMCRFEVYPQTEGKCKNLIFGNNIQMNDFCHICAIDSVEIGDNCLLASHIYISDNSHGSYHGDINDSSPDVAPVHRNYITSPVKIGKNCWLGEGVIVLPGVTIGDGCIIGAHSVVVNSIPTACVAVGSPAKVVKTYNYKSKRWERV